MDAVYDDQELLGVNERRNLNVKRNGPSVRRLVAQVAFFAMTLAAAWFGRTQWWGGVALFLHGTAHMAFFGLLHESCHLTVFTSRNANIAVGWLAALSQPMSPALMRAFHFAHHRHTHDVENDPELAGFAFLQRWPRHVMWLVTISGLPILMARTGWALFAALTPRFGPFAAAWSAVLPFVAADARARVAWEARLLVALHAGLITLGILSLPIILVSYAGLVIGHALLSVYLPSEHRGLPASGTILDRTRSIRVGGFGRWLLWNMPYHAEHHAWPSIPWHRLPEVHAAVREHLPHATLSVMQLHWRRGVPVSAPPPVDGV